MSCGRSMKNVPKLSYEIINVKMDKNEAKYPVEKARGVATQSCSPFLEKMMARKKGAPSRDVIAPTGRAEPLPMLRERVSASRSSTLPLRAEAGTEMR